MKTSDDIFILSNVQHNYKRLALQGLILAAGKCIVVHHMTATLVHFVFSLQTRCTFGKTSFGKKKSIEAV